MYCPKCAQKRISDQTRFCSSCGYLLTGTAELLENGGVIPGTGSSEMPKPISRRSRGVKQGIFIFLISVLIFPILAVIESSYNDYFNVTLVTTTLLGVGGLLRIAYALMFEPGSGDSTLQMERDGQKALTVQETISDDDFAAPITGKWRNTEELETAAVAEGDTKKLERDTGQ